MHNPIVLLLASGVFSNGPGRGENVVLLVKFMKVRLWRRGCGKIV